MKREEEKARDQLHISLSKW